MDTQRGKRSGMNWEVGIAIYTLLCMELITNENLLYNMETLLSALWWPKWEGNPENRACMHSWFTLLYSRNYLRRRRWHPTPVLLPGKIPWMEEPDRLQSMGSLRVWHDWATSLSLFTFMHWRRKWQSTPVFLPGESQGPGSLVGCRLRGRTVLVTIEVT